MAVVIATAKAAATSTYQPILLGVNTVYILLFWFFRYRRDFDTPLFSWGTIAIHLLLGGLQYYAYLGLTDSSNKSSSSSSLDLLAVTLVIQFAGSFLSSYAYYGLILVFIWGGWTTYRMFRPATTGSTTEATTDTTASTVDAEKKQRRAERRRQKRM